MYRYQEAFDKFKHIESDAEVAKRVANILADNEQSNCKADVYKFLYGCIDLTSLSTLDTKEGIWKLVESVNDFEGTRPDVPNVAAICTYPIFTETVKQALTAQDVKIAAVTGGFPSAQTFSEIKIAETSLAIMNGAEEVDTVLNLGYLQEENYEELAEDIQEIKECGRGEATLKVILETGALQTAAKIQKAAIFAIYAGADFIKTSTGKEFPGATPEAVYTMCQVIKSYHEHTNKMIGIKVSGGVRTAEDAVKYYTIVKTILGEEWLNKAYFRIGASGLASNLLHLID